MPVANIGGCCCGNGLIDPCTGSGWPDHLLIDIDWDRDGSYEDSGHALPWDATLNSYHYALDGCGLVFQPTMGTTGRALELFWEVPYVLDEYYFVDCLCKPLVPIDGGYILGGYHPGGVVPGMVNQVGVREPTSHCEPRYYPRGSVPADPCVGSWAGYEACWANLSSIPCGAGATLYSSASGWHLWNNLVPSASFLHGSVHYRVRRP